MSLTRSLFGHNDHFVLSGNWTEFLFLEIQSKIFTIASRLTWVFSTSVCSYLAGEATKQISAERRRPTVWPGVCVSCGHILYTLSHILNRTNLFAILSLCLLAPSLLPVMSSWLTLWVLLLSTACHPSWRLCSTGTRGKMAWRTNPMNIDPGPTPSQKSERRLKYWSCLCTWTHELDREIPSF